MAKSTKPASKGASWLNRASAAWVVGAAGLASVAAVIGNLDQIKKFVWPETHSPKLELAIGDIYAHKSDKGTYEIAFTVTKNRDAGDKYCQAYFDTPTTYGFPIGRDFELPSGIESQRHHEYLEPRYSPSIEEAGGMIWVSCHTATTARIPLNTK